MIREAKPEDCVDLAVLSLQVWLHTYATKGIREKISRFALNTFTEKYFLDLLNRSENKVQVYIRAFQGSGIGFYQKLGFKIIGELYKNHV